tara:strand:+ start:553 stop:900 length:348 start_codon:yes stop_codon:yes gene_type:complete
VPKRLSEAEVAQYCQHENIFRAAQFHARGVLNMSAYGTFVTCGGIPPISAMHLISSIHYSVSDQRECLHGRRLVYRRHSGKPAKRIYLRICNLNYFAANRICFGTEVQGRNENIV